jgi:hypothetical protein
MDSLMAIECRDALEASLGCSLPATLLFDYPTLFALVEHLFNEVLKLHQAPAVPAALPVMPDEAAGDTLDDMGVIEVMDDEGGTEIALDLFSAVELRALLDEKLAAIEDIEYAIGD